MPLTEPQHTTLIERRQALLAAGKMLKTALRAPFGADHDRQTH